MNLKSLWIGSNSIRSIGNILDVNSNLEELNIAANQVWSFKDIINLVRLTSLRRLSLADPMFGENPVCELCNYTTYVLFHLQQVQGPCPFPPPPPLSSLCFCAV